MKGNSSGREPVRWSTEMGLGTGMEGLKLVRGQKAVGSKTKQLGFKLKGGKERKW